MAQYPQPQGYYPPQPPAYYPPTTQSSSLAIVSLVSGILAWLGCAGLGAIVAIICGHIAKGQIRDSQGRLTGGGMATAGLVLGYIQIALIIIGVCLYVLFMVGAFAIFGLTAGSTGSSY